MKVKKLVTDFRIQAERTINGINSFHVLKGVLADKLLHLIDNIFETCSFLCNLKPEIFKKKNWLIVLFMGIFNNNSDMYLATYLDVKLI